MSLRERLNAAKDLQKENYIAVLGPSGTGKTVFITLLNHALDNYFLERHQDLTSYPKDGRPFLEACENSMIRGEFPERTQQLSRDMIVIELSGSGSTGTSIELRFPDISGEDYNHMCLGSDVRGEERVSKVLDMGRAKRDHFGPMTYAMYAKAYVILIDCSKFDDWETMGTRYARAITTIHDFKKVTNTSTNDKIDSLIAVILTKADNLPNRGELTPDDLVKKHLKRFYNTLNAVHGGKRGFFMVHVEVRRNAENVVEDPKDLKVAVPLTYDHEEYIRFVEWLHQNI